MNLRENCSASSPPYLKKALRESVTFNGWRNASASFLTWAGKMAAFHEATWRKAGIFEAVKASTTKIHKNIDLVMVIAEKWCPETNTFVFPWGETTITLEDVMVLLGFSVLGLPVFATLDCSEKKEILRNMEREWVKIKKDKVTFVNQVAWMKRFMDCGDELEHVAFLALWLSYFVFPSCYYHISDTILPIAVHLSSGTRIAIAPAVLAHLYSELSLLKTHIRDFSKPRIRIDLSSLFKLVHVWTWERFKELQPKPVPMILNNDQTRLDRWHDVKQRTSDVRQVLDNSKIEWRPYTVSLGNWNFPQFYPEKAMWVPVGPNLDDEFISFARCIKVSALVGITCVEHYFPDRVASQFGMLQDVPAPVNRNSLSQEVAWNDYNKPISDLILYIPSRSAIPRVTPMFCEWLRKTFPELPEENQVSESAETSKSRNIMKQVRRKYMKRAAHEKDESSSMGHCQIHVPSYNDDDSLITAQMRLDKEYSGGGDASEPLAKKSRLEVDNNDSGHPQKLAMINKIRIHLKHVRDKRRKYMKQARDKRHKHTKEIPSENNDEDDDSLTNAQMRLDKKYSGEEGDKNDPSPLKKLASLGANGDETDVSPPEIVERNEETNETGRKTKENMVLSPFDENSASHALLGATGGMAGEKACIEAEKEDDDSLFHKKVAVEELGIKACSCEKIASGGSNEDETSMGLSSYNETNTWDPHVCSDGAIEIVVLPPETRETFTGDELNVHGSNEPECLVQEDDKLCNEAEKEDDVVADGRINESNHMVPDEPNNHVNVDDGNQRQDCLLHENGIRSEETPKSNVQLENSKNRNDDDGNDSFGKSLNELKVMAASLEERINTAQRKVAWLKERKAMKQRKLAAASLI